MGYRIEYTSGHRRSRKRRKSILAGVIVVLLGLSLLHPKGRLILRNAFLPGDEEVTAAALGDLVVDLKAGQELPEAVSAFCNTILTEQGT